MPNPFHQPVREIRSDRTVDLQGSPINPDQERCLSAIMEGIENDFSGEVVVQGSGKTGRIFVTRGRIAWIAASSVKKTLLKHLAEKRLVASGQLREVLDQCKQTKKNFAETIVERHLVDRGVLRNELLQHISISFLEILSWLGLETTFVQMERSYSGSLTYSAQELVRAAAALDSDDRSGLNRMIRLAEKKRVATSATRAPKRESPTASFAPRTAEGAEKNEMKPATSERLQRLFEGFRADSGSGLLYCDIVRRADGKSILGHNTNQTACALLNRVSEYLDESLTASGFPPIGRYYLIELVGRKAVIVVYLSDDCLLTMLCDTKRIQLGMMLDCIVPDMVKHFRAIIKA